MAINQQRLNLSKPNIAANNPIAPRVDYSGLQRGIEGLGAGVGQMIENKQAEEMRLQNESKMAFLNDVSAFNSSLLQSGQNTWDDAIIQKSQQYADAGDMANYEDLQKMLLMTPEQKRQEVTNDFMRSEYEAGRDPQAAMAKLRGKSSAIKGIEGDMTFVDEKGNYFSQQTFLDANNQKTNAVLTDVTGQGQKPSGKLTAVTSSTGQTAQQRIEEKGAGSKSAARGKAEGEFASRNLIASTKGEIVKAQNIAAAKNKDAGETQVAYHKLQASMPSLTKVTSELKELANVATYTRAGKVFDFAAKELGFGAPKGATAAAKYTAIVSNQVLPLLKQTLGAAFTASEYEKLEGTMGDPNLTPEEKQVQLDAFMESKNLTLETMERELGLRPMIDDGSGAVTQKPISEMTEAEIDAELAQ